MNTALNNGRDPFTSDDQMLTLMSGTNKKSDDQMLTLGQYVYEYGPSVSI